MIEKLLLACALGLNIGAIDGPSKDNGWTVYDTPAGMVAIGGVSHSVMQKSPYCNKSPSHPRYGEPCYGIYLKNADGSHSILLSDRIPSGWKTGILAHEFAHIKVGPRDERAADRLQQHCMKSLK